MKKNQIVTFPFSTQYNIEKERAENIIGRKIAEGRRRKGWNLAMMTENLEPYGIHLTKASVNKWETGETVPSAYQFLAVCDALDLDDHLSFYRSSRQEELNEEGISLLARYKRDLICSGNYAPAAEEEAEEAEMPVGVMPAAAGSGNFLDDEEQFELQTFRREDVPARADVGILISGDSMEPVYHDGDLVWVQKCEELSPGEVGIFIYDDKAYLKQYEEQFPEEEYLEEFTDSYGNGRMQAVLVSFNSKKYDPIPVLPYSPFRIYGRVVH